MYICFVFVLNCRYDRTNCLAEQDRTLYLFVRMCPLLMTCCLVNTVCDTTVCWPSFGGLPYTYTAMAWINVACLHWCYVDVQHAGNLHLYTCWITPLSFGFVSIRREYFMSFFPRRKSKQMRMRILKIGRAGHGRRNVSKSGGGGQGKLDPTLRTVQLPQEKQSH